MASRSSGSFYVRFNFVRSGSNNDPRHPAFVLFVFHDAKDSAENPFINFVGIAAPSAKLRIALINQDDNAPQRFYYFFYYFPNSFRFSVPHISHIFQADNMPAGFFGEYHHDKTLSAAVGTGNKYAAQYRFFT